MPWKFVGVILQMPQNIKAKNVKEAYNKIYLSRVKVSRIPKSNVSVNVCTNLQPCICNQVCL